MYARMRTESEGPKAMWKGDPERRRYYQARVCIRSENETCCYGYAYANDDRGLMTYWVGHGRLRVVLVFCQSYVVLLSY